MSGYLPDDVLGRLQRNLDLPDLSATDYDLLEEIGPAGTAVVYAARDRQLGREVALKVFNSPQTSAADAHKMLEQARILARLDHPGIAPVYAAGVLPDGRVFYAMKLARGTRLDEYVLHKPGLPETLRLFVRISEPVAFAHARGIVHRDLRPHNIIVGEYGEVLVLDWRIAGEACCASHSVIAGTAEFMAPEQAAGDPVGPEADVYSLGRLLEWMVQPSSTGEAIPRPIRSILRYATAAQPQERYANAEDLTADVNRFLNGYPVLAHKDNLWERTMSVVERNRYWLALLLAYLVMRTLMFLFTRF